MSRVFRQISRGAQKLGRQLQKGSDTFGRQLVNTTNTISKGIADSSKTVAGIERAFKDVPVVGGVVSGLAGRAQDALKVANDLNISTRAGGQGIRDFSRGDYESAGKNFEKAAVGGINAVNEGIASFVE